MKPITREWLKLAQDDLDACKQLLSNKQLTNVVSFHAQQVVEKSLKAVIEEFQTNVVKIHNLLRLSELAKENGVVISDLNMLGRLDQLYTESRYPSEMGLLPYGKPSLEDSAEFYRFAEDVYHQIKSFLMKIS